jgi:SAM-dependent methyltransferase
VYDGKAFPFPDACFHLAVSRWVHEHLPDPAMHFKEVERVLAPGGTYVFRTINLHHYVALVARIVPHSVQVPVARWLRRIPPDDHDPYPTFYRANTRRRITQLCDDAGLELVTMRMTESYPAYGMGSKLLFHVFRQYERFVNASDRFQDLRHMIDCVMRKPARQ